MLNCKMCGYELFHEPDKSSYHSVCTGNNHVVYLTSAKHNQVLYTIPLHLNIFLDLIYNNNVLKRVFISLKPENRMSIIKGDFSISESNKNWTIQQWIDFAKNFEILK